MSVCCLWTCILCALVCVCPNLPLHTCSWLWHSVQANTGLDPVIVWEWGIAGGNGAGDTHKIRTRPARSPCGLFTASERTGLQHDKVQHKQTPLLIRDYREEKRRIKDKRRVHCFHILSMCLDDTKSKGLSEIGRAKWEMLNKTC